MLLQRNSGMDDGGFMFLLSEFLILILIVLIILHIIKSRTKTLHSNWNTLIDDFNFSTIKFYKLLKSQLESQEIKNVRFEIVELSEGHSFSSYRKYLRVTWNKYTYDCCLAPFGKGVFVSWWLYSKRSLLEIVISAIPFVGENLARKWFPATYYKYDTATMFMNYVQLSVLAVIDDITKTTGYKLSGDDRKAHMKDIFKR